MNLPKPVTGVVQASVTRGMMADGQNPASSRHSTVRIRRCKAAVYKAHKISDALWHEQVLKQDFCSIISLPLGNNGEVIGTLTIYAREVMIRSVYSRAM